MADTGGVEAGSGQRVHGDSLCGLVGASASSLYGEGHLIGAGLFVSVARVLPGPCLVVAEVPLEAVEAMSSGGAGELCGLALADGGGIEAGSWQRVHGDGLGALMRASSSVLHGEGYLVGACLCVSMCGILPRARLVVAEVPLEAVDALSSGGAGELCGLALADGGGVEARCRQRVHGDGLRDLVRASSSVLHGEGHLVGACLCVSMCGVLSRSRLVVAEVPLEAVDALSCGGAGELSGLALADGGGVEARRRQGVHGDGLRDLVRASSGVLYGEGHMVGACLCVGMCGILSRTCLVVTEVPLEAVDALSR